jgi:hypothetical protein
MSTRKPNSNLEKNQRTIRDASRTLKAKSQKEKESNASEPQPHQSDNLVNSQTQAIEEALLKDAELPRSQDALEQYQTKDEFNWLSHFQQHSQLLMAVVEPGTFILQYANNYFCSMMGIAGNYSDLETREIRLPDLLPDLKVRPWILYTGSTSCTWYSGISITLQFLRYGYWINLLLFR